MMHYNWDTLYLTELRQAAIISAMARAAAKYRLLILCCATFLSWHLSAQNAKLVYQPEYQIGAVGNIRLLEEREDGDIVRKFTVSEATLPVEFIHKSYSDGKLRRLIWHYESDVGTGNYTIEETKSTATGEWRKVGLYNYRNHLLENAKFYKGSGLVEERRYFYDGDGRVTEEHTIQPGDSLSGVESTTVIIEFRRPADDFVEAYLVDKDRAERLLARLQYDERGRILMEERFLEGRLDRRDAFRHDERGRLIEHVRYDSRELPIKHVNYNFSIDGTPQSVIHRDVHGMVLYGLSYSREKDGNTDITTVRNHRGQVSGTIETERQTDGALAFRREKFLLGEEEMVISYSEFDEKENWLRKQLSTYAGSSLKKQTVTTRFIRYFD